jgi:hypothetical protein
MGKTGTTFPLFASLEHLAVKFMPNDHRMLSDIISEMAMLTFL